MSRAALRGARRIVVKIGSSSLTDASGGGLDSGAVTAVADAVAGRFAAGTQVVLVSSARSPRGSRRWA